MKVLLDTQILIAVGLQGIDVIPAKARGLVADSKTERLVSAVSLTEIAVKVSVKRLVMARDSVG